MKNIVSILLFIVVISFLCFSCKRKHSSVLVKVYGNGTGTPVKNAKVKVVRKGREGFFITKEHIVAGTDYTNLEGEVLI